MSLQAETEANCPACDPVNAISTVLLAEDEPLIRMLMADILAEEGFEVLKAHHAASALQLLEFRAATVHFLLTDIQMPGQMDGLDLAHHVAGHWPWIALAIASAAGQPAAHELPSACKFFSKPYHLEGVVSHIREATDGRREAKTCRPR
jgi:two-component system cell cycle response regulator CpdR